MQHRIRWQAYTGSGDLLQQRSEDVICLSRCEGIQAQRLSNGRHGPEDDIRIFARNDGEDCDKSTFHRGGALYQIFAERLDDLNVFPMFGVGGALLRALEPFRSAANVWPGRGNAEDTEAAGE